MICPCGRSAYYPLDAPEFCCWCFIRPGEPAVLDDAFRERIKEMDKASMEMKAKPLLPWARKFQPLDADPKKEQA